MSGAAAGAEGLKLVQRVKKRQLSGDHPSTNWRVNSAGPTCASATSAIIAISATCVISASSATSSTSATSATAPVPKLHI